MDQHESGFYAFRSSMILDLPKENVSLNQTIKTSFFHVVGLKIGFDL